ncbi:ABC-type transport system permease protein I [Alloalcanivorax dieselolei B5]|uniref:ABC-type transport system permease protein I n=1 Tax=Alcanivorax dieselolei (strain DSM 16502 / CGMCC 1.3690 / MCCC 1A00001 / B-5) TaxID=930169 RepID=K0CIN0_ALCDB|nr:branched-chain amino acid ABC transporter permease [Alloalcanivorax dieselolei]AFT72240.1 ABC-type transport system permease protein I [Alloalcanivorax dieselolei B5]GGJ76333.1 branched-chain amino acid ABC transporter permease [Alloalcanivorax dieselolei]
MDFASILIIEILGSIAILVLISIGLAVVFGMMKVINMAHGEFLMLGGYVTIYGTNHGGLSFWVSSLILAPIVVGLIGLLLEWLVIRHLYGRMIDTMLATWGISLALIGGMTMLVGNTTTGISTPLPSVSIGEFSVSGYVMFLIALAIMVFALLYVLFKLTTFGLLARATTQNADMVAALGGNPRRIYALTFGLGAALAGLGGAALAPLTGVIPTIGASYIAKAFITVISGGFAVIAGNLSAATLFGTVGQVFTYLYTPVIGEVALLLTAIVLIRLLPKGITGRFFRRSI